MLGIAEQIGRRQDRKGRDLVLDILRRDVAHLKVAPLERHQFSPMFEKCRPIVAVEGIAIAKGGCEFLHHFGADILLRKHGREVQLDRALRQ